jgi:DNA-binding CsgD family transcriptional regulator
MRIAENLQINVKTVHTYCTRIKDKLHLKTSAELFREAVRWQEMHESSS